MTARETASLDEQFRRVLSQNAPFGHVYENALLRQHVTQGTCSELARELVAERPRPSGMPLLDFTASLFEKTFDLSDTFLIASIQILDDAALLLSVLQRFGLDPRAVALLGKPYSTSMMVVADLLERGVYVHPASYLMDEFEPLLRAREPAVHEVLQRARAFCEADPGRKLLLLDSGGAFIRALHGDEFRALLPRAAGVEVTSQGIFHLEELALDIPVINVARSWAKVTYESVDIGIAVAKELDVHLDNVGVDVERALVLGYGTVGRPVATCLSERGMDVSFFDTRSPSDEAIAHQNARDRREAIRGAQLIVGCSGRQSLTRSDWDHFADGVIVASASSYDVEVCGWQARSAYTRSALPISVDALDFEHLDDAPRGRMFLGTHADPSHFNYPVRLQDGRRAYFLNGGCPVNFTGRPVAMPLQASALTMSLELCGIAQVTSLLRKHEPGVISLSREEQTRIVNRHLGARRAGAVGSEAG